MKRITKQAAFLVLIPYLLLATDHLLISELVLQPSKGEYAIIQNPTSGSINLVNYYLSDAIDAANGEYYYNLPTGDNFWSGSGSDFVARLPDTTLGAGGSLKLGLARNADFFEIYSAYPDYSIKDDSLTAIEGENTIGGSSYGKLGQAESLILFYWDGSSTEVQDVDYLVWGEDAASATEFMIDKTGVGNYLADTPVASQLFMPTHLDGSKLIRNSDEGTETTTGGNGITGHDETSENLAETWSVVDLTIVKPEISSKFADPSDPETGEDIIVTVAVTDDIGISTVTLTYTFPSDTGTPVDLSMTNSTGDTWTATIPATGAEGELAYYITAVNTSGLTTTSDMGGVVIADPPPPPELLTIARVQDSISVYNTQIVTIHGVVTIGPTVITDFISGTAVTSAYMQDGSGRGINVFYWGEWLDFKRGDSISVTGEITDYLSNSQADNGYTLRTTEIVLGTPADFTVIAEGKSIPGDELITIPDMIHPLEGSFRTLKGVIASVVDVGGGRNVALEDQSGELTTVRVWEATGIFDDENIDQIIYTGAFVEVHGVIGYYNDEPQLLLGYIEDIVPSSDGEDSDGGTSLVVTPNPFIPQLSENIQYSYKFPANSRITLRVFDMSGHSVATLFEDYRSLPLEVIKTWDGRNEINEIVPPGVYLMHLETVNRSTGEILTDMAPVVIGSK